jgi:hypothetical protein
MTTPSKGGEGARAPTGEWAYRSRGAQLGNGLILCAWCFDQTDDGLSTSADRPWYRESPLGTVHEWVVLIAATASVALVAEREYVRAVVEPLAANRLGNHPRAGSVENPAWSTALSALSLPTCA